MDKKPKDIIVSHLDSMNDFAELVDKMVIKEIGRYKYGGISLGDVDSITRQVSYLLLKNRIKSESFVNRGGQPHAYVLVLIKSCIARLTHGRFKHGDTYSLIKV